MQTQEPVSKVFLLAEKTVYQTCYKVKALCHKGIWGSGCIDPCFLDLGTSWRWVVSFTLQPFYSWGESPVPIGKGAWWAPEPVWTTWGRTNSWPYQDSNSDPSVVQPVANRYTNCAIMDPYQTCVTIKKPWSQGSDQDGLPGAYI
jgi:hypothetical protein